MRARFERGGAIEWTIQPAIKNVAICCCDELGTLKITRERRVDFGSRVIIVVLVAGKLINERIESIITNSIVETFS